MWPNSETTILRGRVIERESGGAIPFAGVRLVGTSRGTSSNRDGNYLLRVPKGELTIQFSAIGYKTVRKTVKATADTTTVDASLEIGSLQSPSVLVIAEDPAVKIMRKVLERKKAQRDSLRTYSYQLYTKFVASADTSTAGRYTGRGDTSIISIFESYSKGFYQKPDLYYNEIVQRRQTANIPPQANFLAFGTNINTYEDLFTIINEEVFTPFHPSALDYYDFTLEKEYTDDGDDFARIRIEPKTALRKLFQGFMDVNVSKAMPSSVTLKPSKAVVLPFDATFSVEQRFIEVDSFVVPSGFRIISSVSAELLFVFAPRLDINIETIAYDYEINREMPDGVFERRRVEISKAAETFDSTFWFEKAIMPLRPEEAIAYQQIEIAQEDQDSVASSLLDRYLGPITRFFGQFNRRPFTGFEDIFRFNRVHGFYLGLGTVWEFGDHLQAWVKAGYGTADRRLFGDANLLAFLDENRRYWFGTNIYSRLQRRDNPYAVGVQGITNLSLLAKNDYGDYYYNQGVQVSFEATFGQLRFIRRDIFSRPSGIRLFARAEEHRNALVNSDFSLFARDRQYRENPTIAEGSNRSAGFELYYGYSPFRRISKFGISIAMERSDPRVLGSDFDYTQLTGALILRTRTLPLWRLDFRLSGGHVWGKTPGQRFFSLESAIANTAADGVLRGMAVKEFYGDRFVSASFEHNFGEVIPGILRIPNLASFGIELISIAGLGYTDFSPSALLNPALNLRSTAQTREQVYYELGLGLNKILLFFRFDVAARLSQVATPRYMVTFSAATF